VKRLLKTILVFIRILFVQIPGGVAKAIGIMEICQPVHASACKGCYFFMSKQRGMVL